MADIKLTLNHLSGCEGLLTSEFLTASLLKSFSRVILVTALNAEATFCGPDSGNAV